MRYNQLEVAVRSDGTGSVLMGVVGILALPGLPDG